MIVYIQDGFPCHFKGGRKMLLSGFFPLMGYIPRTPLAENHFAKRPLAEMGGTALARVMDEPRPKRKHF